LAVWNPITGGQLESSMPRRRDVPKSRRQYVSQSTAMPLAREALGVKSAPVPGFVEPLLATQVDKPPSGGRWVHEIKYDGYRIQIHKSDAGVRCFTRRGYDWAKRFPSLVVAAGQLQEHNVVLDGEVVVVTEKGDTDYNALESYVSSKRADRDEHNLQFCAFDLLYLEGLDMRDVPLIERKKVLKELLSQLDKSPITYSEHLEEDGPAVFRGACDLEWEGIVSKLKDGRYRSGRNMAWTKVTCRHRETFVIAGLAFKGSKFDGIYLGRRENGGLMYAGKVETGFTDQQVQRLKARAARFATREQPFAERIRKPKAHWLKPKLLGEVEYRRLTSGGLLRHPSYKGLREDL
jgi:bifunctional non-homologous end joining protein LigD